MGPVTKDLTALAVPNPKYLKPVPEQEVAQEELTFLLEFCAMRHQSTSTAVAFTMSAWKS
jgi:hypothetical protein